MQLTDAKGSSRFRPTSWADFKIYAEHLSWILELERSRGAELLARVYGYAHLHELKAALKTPGEFGFQGCVNGRKPFDPSFGNRILELSAAELGVDYPGLPARAWKVRDAAFDAPPGEHRSAFRRVKRQIMVGDGTESAEGAPAGHYAVLEDDGEEVRLIFTETGLAVYDALIDAIPDRYGRIEDFEQRIDRVEDMVRRFPNNPWCHAVFVSEFAAHYFQGDWAQGLASEKGTRDAGYTQLDAHEGFAQHSRANASVFLPHAERAIELFDELLEGKGKRWVPHNLSFTGGEAHYFPAVLYWGAYVAANAGDAKRATKWAKRTLEIVEHDNFGARYLLGALYLNEGRKPSAIHKLFRNDVDDAWGLLCAAASYAAQGDREQTVQHLLRMFERVWAPVEIFSDQRWKEARSDARIHSNHDTPAWFQELRFRTKPFWQREQHVEGFFKTVAEDAEFRRALLRRHATKSKVFGLIFLSKEEASERQVAATKALHEFREVAAQRLRVLWDIEFQR